MRFRLLVEVEVERQEGKFASRDDLGGQLAEALEGADPGELWTENDSTYSVVDWSVGELEEGWR